MNNNVKLTVKIEYNIHVYIGYTGVINKPDIRLLVSILYPNEIECSVEIKITDWVKIINSCEFEVLNISLTYIIICKSSSN